MTQGKPASLLIRFAIPLILTTLLQQTYTLCDSIIIGQMLGADAFAAVGSAAFLYGIPLNILLGCTQGFGVVLSQQYGAKNELSLQRFFRTAMLLSIAIALGVSVLGLLLLQPLLTIMATPPELTGDCYAYLFCLWTGLAITAALNMEASALRSAGNSQIPLRALMVSSLVNIVLDYLLVAALHAGVIGTALATLLSQLLAAVYCLYALRKLHMPPFGEHVRVQSEEVRELLRMGIPPALSHGVTAMAGGLYQTVINGFGVAVVTGMSASRRYFDLLNIIGYGMEGAAATYTGQNAGAKNYTRIREGTRIAILLGMAAFFIIQLPAYIFAERLVMLIIPSTASKAIEVGVAALRVEAIFMMTMYLLCTYRAAVLGLGNALVPMLSGFGELLIKAAAILLLPMWVGQSGLYFVDAAAWLPIALLLIIDYHILIRKKEKSLISCRPKVTKQTNRHTDI